MKLRDGYSEPNRGKPGNAWDERKYYSELILDSAVFTNMLPGSIEAFFYQSGPTGKGRCFDTFNMLTHKKMHKCEEYARPAHQTFPSIPKHFGLSGHDVPLLALDIWNWNMPFSHPAVKPQPSPPITGSLPDTPEVQRFDGKQAVATSSAVGADWMVREDQQRGRLLEYV